jgi:SAM-dependent methyltransferase
MTSIQFDARCDICERTLPFQGVDWYWWCRDGLISDQCPMGRCATRERALAGVLFSLVDREAVKQFAIHESSPVMRGISLWLQQNCPGYVATGYFPEHPFGIMQGTLRNEDLEHQTFADATFDLVVHLDVMEHIFRPFAALDEIHRTLKPGGLCIFTAPTYCELVESCQVAFMENGQLRIEGEAEYHGNPQRPADGALVTWRYGHDLPLLIFENTSFKQIEHRRQQNSATAAMGYMSDVYILRK